VLGRRRVPAVAASWWTPAVASRWTPAVAGGGRLVVVAGGASRGRRDWNATMLKRDRATLVAVGQESRPNRANGDAIGFHDCRVGVGSVWPTV
jgi:hypothetical protein